MASSDNSTIPFSQIDVTATMTDGTNTITMSLVQGDPDWTIEGRPYVEARVRNKHQSTPVLRRTGDGNVTFKLDMLFGSYRGSTAASPYEVLTRTGLGASWGNTGAGDEPMTRISLPYNSSAAGGPTQTVTFNYCVARNVTIAKVDGLYHLTADITDHESEPTIT